MSIREDDVPVAPVYTFADAHMASGEQRRRILEAIVRQEKQRRERLQAITRVTMAATPTPITSSSARKVNRVR